MSEQPTPKSKHIAARNLELREQYFPGSEAEVWSRQPPTVGYTTIPRILPNVLHLITLLHKREAGSKGNPSKIYFDLWCRANDQAFLEIHDVEEMAYSAGYTGARAGRTWQEHVNLLREMGFIKTAEMGNSKTGVILILNPYLIAQRLKEDGKVPENWWNMFVRRVERTKAKLPSQKPAPTKEAPSGEGKGRKTARNIKT